MSEEKIYVTQENFNSLVQAEMEKKDFLPGKVKEIENLIFYLKTVAEFELLQGNLIRCVALSQYVLNLKNGSVKFKPTKQRELSDREMEKRGIQEHARALAKENGLKYSEALRQVKMMDALPKEEAYGRNLAAS